MTDKERENVAALRCLTEDDCICFPNVALTAMRDAADLIESLSKQCDDQNEMLHWAYGILKKLDKGLEEHGFDSFEEVYAQLEQVTREQDALLDEVRGECDVCANKKDCTAPKCRKSQHKECEECPCRTCIIDTNWKWEGVEATNDAQKGSDAKS